MRRENRWMRGRFNLAILKRVSAGVLLSLLLPLILLSVVYGQMNAKIRSQYFERSMTGIQNSLHEMELVFDNLDQIAVFLGDNYDVNAAYNLDRSEVRKQQTQILKAQQVLGSIGAANDDVANIQLFSARSGTLIDYKTVSLYPERYYGGDFLLKGYDWNAFLTEYCQGTAHLGCSRGLVAGARFPSPETALIYQIRHIGGNMKSGNNRALFYLPEARMLELFSPLDEYGESSFILVNDAGETLLERGSEEMLETLADQVARLTPGGASSDYYTARIGRTDLSFTYCRSERRGWLCIAALPVRAIVSATSNFRTHMIVLLVVALLAGITLLILYGTRLAYPAYEVADILSTGTGDMDFSGIAEKVRALSQSNEELRERIREQVSAVRAEAFIRLLTGEDLSETEKAKALANLGIRTNADHYMILLINVNDIRIDTDLDDYGMQRVLLDNLLKKQTALEISDIFPVDIERSVLCLTADGISMADFQRRAEETVSLARKSLGVGVEYSYSIGGDIVDSAAGLPDAFLHAQLALKIPQNIFGSHVIQWYERAKQYADLASAGSAEDNVSQQNRALIESIRQFILENYSDPQLSLSLVGGKFYMTEVYLSKLFKKATGENFSRFVEGVRMNRAKQLLDEGHKVSEVAQSVGYNSPQVFRRAWKRYFREDEAE